MAAQTGYEERVTTGETYCPHYWVIESAEGSVSKGGCQRCGAVREFRNSFQELLWDDDRSLVPTPWTKPSLVENLFPDDVNNAEGY